MTPWALLLGGYDASVPTDDPSDLVAALKARGIRTLRAGADPGDT